MSAPHDEALYLRADTKVELLSARWYAWQHLISPVQSSLNLAYRFLPLLESFVANPTVHEEASRDPALMGGPYIDLTPAHVPLVEALIDETRQRCSPMLDLAKDMKNVDRMLQVKAKGFSLDELYEKLPASLAGIAVFAYDAAFHPVMRLREELLYEDERYFAFREVFVHRCDEQRRKFFLNTPRLVESDDQRILPWRFDDSRLDILAAMRLAPKRSMQIERELGIPAKDTAAFLTNVPPTRKAPDYDGDGVRVRYFGHASVLVQSRESSILIDPRFASQRDDSLATLTFDDLPDFIDYVVLSHSHQDHFCAETLLQLRRRIGRVLVPRNNRGMVADPSMKLTLRALGIQNVDVMDEMEAVSLDDGELVVLPFPGEHCDLDIHSKQCVAVRLRGRTFLFLADSDAVDAALYTRLAGYVKDVDALFIGMECFGAPLSWMYGPLLGKEAIRRDDESRRGSGSNFARARNVIRAIGCTHVYVYAMGMEPWNRHLLGLEYSPSSIQMVESDKLIASCRDEGRQACRFKGCRELEF